MSTPSTPDYNYVEIEDLAGQKKKKRRSLLTRFGMGCGGCLVVMVCLCALIGTGFWTVSRSEAASSSQSTYALSGDVLLRLSADVSRGSIRLTGDDQADAVHLTVTRKARSLTESYARDRLDAVTVEVTDNTANPTAPELVITSDIDNVIFNGLAPVFPSVELEMVIPLNISLDVRTGNGEVVLENAQLVGKSQVHTGNGQVTLRNVQANETLVVETNNGAVEIEDLTAQATFTARTSNGRIQMENVDLQGGGQIRTNNGAIEMDGELQGDDATRYEISAGNGNVEITLPESAVFRFEATVGNGTLGLHFNATQNSNTSGNQQSGCYNAGEDTDDGSCEDAPLLDLSINNGSLSLRTRS